MNKINTFQFEVAHACPTEILTIDLQPDVLEVGNHQIIVMGWYYHHKFGSTNPWLVRQDHCSDDVETLLPSLWIHSDQGHCSKVSSFMNSATQ